MPLRILAICSRPLIDDGGRPIALLDVAEERLRIETGIERAGNVARVHFLPEATTGGVQAALRDVWNVVHFTGHGTSDGRLVLEDGFGVAHLLTRSETAQLFKAQQTPLVVLSACYSEAVGRELHAAGVPVVVAVDARVPIADLAAIIFAEHFYAALARRWDVQRAFDDAQRAVALDPKVGDAKPPKDAQGNTEETWSQRFKLIGAGQSVVVAGGGAHREASSRPQPVGNVPSRSANFVGRAKEIVDVVKAFDETEAQRVCVYGSGGLGKTELSKAVARWYMERERVGAVLWASASHVEGEYKLRDLASLLSIAARVFGLPVTEQSMFDEQKRVVRDFLAATRALVLLDNWETIEREHRRELWDFALSLPETVRVFVTSRDVLPPKDTRNIELDTLAPKDAAELLLKTARNTGYFDRNPHLMTEEIAILHSLCERLNGYPLAIEVVAGQTFSRSLGEIWADLQRVPKDVLEGKDEITNEPRGVWTSLGLSYDVLSTDEQELFRQMCVLLTPASIEDIATITGVENPHPMLDALVKRSLVRMREGAYALLPIVRDYAQGKHADAGQDPRELHTRAVNHYGQRGTIEGALTASDYLFDLATRFELHDAAEDFFEYVWRFYYTLVARGYWTEARHKTGQLIAVARALGNKQQEARAIGEMGSRFQDIGEYERAEEVNRKAQSLLEESNDKRGTMALLQQRGILAYQQGDYNKSARLYQQALEIAEELGHKKGTAATQHQLAMLAQKQGRYVEAEQLYQQSLKIHKELEDKSGIASSLHQLGNLQYLQGNYNEAEQIYRQNLKIQEELEHKYEIANTLGQLGLISNRRMQMKEALGYFLKAFVIFEELHAPFRQQVLKHIASVREAVGEEQFAAWLRELSTDAERITELLEQNEPDDEQRAEEFVKQLVGVAQAVVDARQQGSAEQRDELAQSLAQTEAGARKQGAAEVVDFFAVLSGLLAGEDVADKIAALAEPYKRIAEQARAAGE